MDEKETVGKKKQKREETIKLRLVTAVLCFLTIFIAEIYSVINIANDITTIVLFAVMALVAAYFVVESLIVLVEQKNEKLAEQYEEIFTDSSLFLCFLNINTHIY